MRNSCDAKHIQKREQFLQHLKDLTAYWSTRPNATPHDIADGMAFNMLVAIDGEAVAVGPFALRPIDERGKEGDDIAGSLHEVWYR